MNEEEKKLKKKRDCHWTIRFFGGVFLLSFLGGILAMAILATISYLLI